MSVRNGPRQQMRANTYPSSLPVNDVLDLQLHRDIAVSDASTIAEAFQTVALTNTSPSRAHASFPDDFDVEGLYWPAHGDASHDSESSLAHTAFRLHEQDRPSTTHEINRNHRTDSLRRGNSRASVPGPSPYSASPRTDLYARNSIREMILSAILSETLDTLERVSLLDDCKNTAEASNLGIPFREILSEPMEHVGVSPLMYELMGCRPDWDGINDVELGTGLEMVLYLIENWSENVLAHGKMGALINVVRTACLRRMDWYEGNRLFQYLRPIVVQSQNQDGRQVFDYDISIAPLGGIHSNNSSVNLDFSAVISLPHFASRLAQPTCPPRLEEESRSPPGRKPPSLSTSTHIPVEFLAASRAWRLKIDSNALALELLDGPGGSIPSNPDATSAVSVDARVKVIMPDYSQNIASSSSSSGHASIAPAELLLSRARLYPLAAEGSGTSEVKISPCFCAGPSDIEALRGLDDTRLLHDGRGALLLELTVRLGLEPFAFGFVNVPNPRNQATFEGVMPRGVTAPLSDLGDEGDLYAPSDIEIDDRVNRMKLGSTLEESEWEEVSQIDETEVTDGGWVKANWSGRDEEL